MSAGPLWITEAEVADLVSLPDALAALEDGLRLEGTGKAQNISRAFGRWGGGAVMHCLGAMFPEAGFVGWKTWVITKAGGAVSYELFDANTGKMLAVIEAMTLGQLRTAAMTGIATKWLSAPDADSLAIVGIGRQAMAQIAAINAVRTLRKVMVCSRDPARREAFAARVREVLGIDAQPAPSIEAAVGEAAITTLVTRAAEPFLSASMLPHGAHLNAVGAILPTHAEFDGDVFERVGMMAVDNVPDVKKNSREFIAHFGDGDWSAVHGLGSIVAEARPRASGVDLTLFKSMGMGISDLSIAVEVYRRAAERNLGKPLGVQKPAPIRWT
jgi:ornithine cyclodeaminase/alanine dehydrogenase-like protein (mu-crystallin family)